MYIKKKNNFIEVKQFIINILLIRLIGDAMRVPKFPNILARIKLLRVFQCFHKPHDLPRIKKKTTTITVRCFAVRALVLLRNNFCPRVYTCATCTYSWNSSAWKVDTERNWRCLSGQGKHGATAEPDNNTVHSRNGTPLEKFKIRRTNTLVNFFLFQVSVD